MPMHKTLTTSELIDELWILAFTIMRSLLLAATSVIYFFVLIVATFADHILAGACALHSGVESWQPVKPEIFETEKP